MAFESVKMHLHVEDAQSFKRSQSNMMIAANMAAANRDHYITQKISRGLDKMGYKNGKPMRRGPNTEIVTEYVYLSPWAWVKRQCVLIDWRMGLVKRARACYSFARNVFGV